MERMVSPAEQVEALGLIAAHETAMADLYAAYAERFPEKTELFSRLAATEREHAQRILSFTTLVRRGVAKVNPGRFPPAMLFESLHIIEDRVRQARDPGLSLVVALYLATELEEGLIEKHYFEAVEGDAPELVSLLQQLDRETAEHRELLRTEWERQRM